MFRRKIIRNRFHLWVFLSKNPKMIKYRARESDIGDLIASHYTMEESEVHINSGSIENEETKELNIEGNQLEHPMVKDKFGKSSLFNYLADLPSSKNSEENNKSKASNGFYE